MYVFNETYESALDIPIPTRKWLITRWNKQKEQEQKHENAGSDTSKPLTEQERRQMIAKAQGLTNKPPQQKDNSPPLNPSSFMHSVRNKGKT